MGMLRLSVTRDYRASPQSAWDLLTDTTQWPLWGPTVLAVTCTERFIRLGSRGRVQIPIGLWVPFIITEYEHLHFWNWKVAGMRATGHRLIAFDENSCRVVFELPYHWFPYAIVCRKAASKLGGLLASMGSD
jgi:hypothetical protein